eukprot:1153920-Amphidinium_carterae.2
MARIALPLLVSMHTIDVTVLQALPLVAVTLTWTAWPHSVSVNDGCMTTHDTTTTINATVTCAILDRIDSRHSHRVQAIHANQEGRDEQCEIKYIYGHNMYFFDDTKQVTLHRVPQCH